MITLTESDADKISKILRNRLDAMIMARSVSRLLQNEHDRDIFDNTYDKEKRNIEECLIVLAEGSTKK